ncbi:hypothetical protein [Cellulomonas oligotrophica]|uniref:Uncharacterized protein n=1 Tax=Cellulomonas oligotrophica TaxID=931536 RepID=A0A7Y9FGX0_9CELL|nr:hypothetical protein [Cellulomonas oligotrophica]NYD87030.1 hypothetical protein [Cellulomonas oligotrophica]GIG32184.1 hypothetical protein Col01nite_13430 [Cellulomonas oligotrophica]
MAGLHELLERWRGAGIGPAPLDEVVAWLRDEYRAYAIPVTAIRREDYENDDEVREGLVDTLMTITDPEVLARIRDDEAREVYDVAAADQDAYWRDLFVEDPDDPGDTLAYRLLLTQHGLGQRTSVVLEREGDVVTGFKVYGQTRPFATALAARIGFPARRPGDETPWPSMVPGDLSDETFVHYLRCLEATGRI